MPSSVKRLKKLGIRHQTKQQRLLISHFRAPSRKYLSVREICVRRGSQIADGAYREGCWHPAIVPWRSLEGGERVDMVAQEGQPVAEDQDAHHVVADLEVLLVAAFRQIGCCDALELAAVELLLGHVEASRLDQYVHEDHVLVVPRITSTASVPCAHPSSKMS